MEWYRLKANLGSSLQAQNLDLEKKATPERSTQYKNVLLVGSTYQTNISLV
jgi:hypothetical protein